MNPLNDGEFAVADTNNVDCFRVIVIGEQQPGQCGADDGEYFYRPDQPVALCDQ